MDCETPVSVRKIDSRLSPSPSKKSTRPSVVSDLISGPRLRYLSPSRKLEARLSVLSLSLRARKLLSEERGIDWDNRRTTKAEIQAQERLSETQEIHYRRLQRNLSDNFEGRLRKIQRERDWGIKHEVGIQLRDTKKTARLRELNADKDDYQRQVWITQRDKSAFLARVKAGETIALRKEREDAIILFKEKIEAYRNKHLEEKRVETTERMYREAGLVQDEVIALDAKCRRLETALKSSRSSVT